MLHLPHCMGTPTWAPTSSPGRRESSHLPGSERFLPSSFSRASYSPSDFSGPSLPRKGVLRAWDGVWLTSGCDVPLGWWREPGAPLRGQGTATRVPGSSQSHRHGRTGTRWQQGPNPRAPVPLHAGTAREKPPGSFLHPRPGCCFLPITIILGRRRPSANSKSCPRHPPATPASTLSGAAPLPLSFYFVPILCFGRGQALGWHRTGTRAVLAVLRPRICSPQRTASEAIVTLSCKLLPVSDCPASAFSNNSVPETSEKKKTKTTKNKTIL